MNTVHLSNVRAVVQLAIRQCPPKKSKKLRAIMAIRASYGCSLTQAKHLVEWAMEGQDLPTSMLMVKID